MNLVSIVRNAMLADRRIMKSCLITIIRHSGIGEVEMAPDKLTWDQMEALGEIEKYWRDRIANEIVENAAAVGDTIATVEAAFTHAEGVARYGK